MVKYVNKTPEHARGCDVHLQDSLQAILATNSKNDNMSPEFRRVKGKKCPERKSVFSGPVIIAPNPTNWAGQTRRRFVQRDDTVSRMNPQIAQTAVDSKDKQTHAIIGAAMEVHRHLVRVSWKPFISRRSL
jgi:hypothetical protein